MRTRTQTSLLDEEEFYWLWILATVTYGVGDTITTIALMRFSPSVEEANAVIRTVVALFGESGLAGLKISVLVLCIGVSAYAAQEARDKVLYYAPPAMLAVVGAFTTVYNIRLMLG